jgi:hypothetical protein
MQVTITRRMVAAVVAVVALVVAGGAIAASERSGSGYRLDEPECGPGRPARTARRLPTPSRATSA